MAFTPQTFPAGGFNGATAEQQQIWWEELSDATAANEAAQNQAIADLQQVQADLAATVASQAAIIADLQTVIRNDAISASWTSPGSILSAADVGADATITIAAHQRKYGDGTTLNVSGDTITGRAFSTTYYIYYNDSSRSDTTPNYQSTTNPNTALPNATNGRHYVGVITTPANGAAGTSGGLSPPGGGGDIGFGSIP